MPVRFLRYLAPLICLLYALAVFSQDEPLLRQFSAPRPMPAVVMQDADLRLELYFASLQQGGVGVLRLSGGDIKSAHAIWLRDRYPFAPLDDAWYAILPVRMDAPTGLRELSVTAFRYAGQARFSQHIKVDSAFYILQEFDMPAHRRRLVNAELEAAEFAQLREIAKPFRREALWDAAGFGMPLEGETTSPYGAFRVMNGDHETRHTGWDQRAGQGEAVHSMAAGQAVFVGALEIRGDSIVLDHGLGVYSLYAHLSEKLVDVGQRVGAGEVVGKSGDTGRSSGPHLHWEVIIGGQWVDGLALSGLWLPA